MRMSPASSILIRHWRASVPPISGFPPRSSASCGATRSRARSIIHHFLLRIAVIIESGTPVALSAVNHVVRDAETGNTLLMGHVTTLKGASRFEVEASWQGNGPDRMKVRGYCSYKVAMPAGQSFVGETLLIHFSDDGVRAMEHHAGIFPALL